MNLKEIVDKELILEEEGGELFRFNGIIFRIKGRAEGDIPHLHFIRSSGKEGAIRLDAAAYFPHGNPPKYTEKLSSKELKTFCTYISRAFKEACRLWNELPTTKFKVNDKVMPDYSKLK